jgi:hypothetical protein
VVQVKVKGQIGEMAKCIDGEPRLADLAKVAPQSDYVSVSAHRCVCMYACLCAHACVCVHGPDIMEDHVAGGSCSSSSYTKRTARPSTTTCRT